MAIVFADGCDSYAATSDLLKKWALSTSTTTFATYTSSGGRNGGGGISFAAGTGSNILNTPAVLTQAANSLYQVGMYIKITAAPSSIPAYIFRYMLPGSSPSCSLAVAASGALVLANNGGSTIASGLKNVCDNQWHWIECSMNPSNTSATHSIYVDGKLDCTNTSGLGAGVTAATFIQFTQTNLGMSFTIDDLVVYDNTGISPVFSDYPLGPRQISTLRPNSDSAVQFTKNTGASNNAALSEQNPDDDTTYVEDGSNGEKDLYGFPSLGFTPTAINGVMENIYVENPFGGTINHTQVCKNSTTQTNGTSTITPSSYTTKQQFFGQDPNTTAAWTKAGLDSALFGFLVG